MNDSLKIQLEKCLDITVDLVNAHCGIPDIYRHPQDLPELYRDIHNIQNRLYAIAQLNGIILKTKLKIK